MKSLLLLFFILFSGVTKATNYYFSTITGDDSRTSLQAQNPFTPWKTMHKLNSFFINLKPGDSTLFRMGEIFTGKLYINKAGSKNSPVVISSYGTGQSQPVFSYDLNSLAESPSKRSLIYISAIQYLVIDGINFTDPTMDPANHDLIANVGYAIDMNKGASFITLKNLNISLMGVGISLQASNSKVQNCHIENMRMVNNTPIEINNNDDFGANGIILGGSDNEISHCSFKDLWAFSKDYIFDGGAVEVYGTLVSRNKILYNTAINCNGFMEFGSNTKGSAVDNLVAYNLLINNGSVFSLHIEGAAGISITNLQLFNNNIIETVKQFTKPPSIFSASPSISTKNVIDIRNNIFWINTNINIIAPNSSLSFQVKHTNNIYHLNGGVLGFKNSNSESILQIGDAIFKNTKSIDPYLWDYRLVVSSLPINFGRDVNLTTDFNGTLLVKGGIYPDAGIFEDTTSYSVLPLKFLSFNGVSNEEKNILNWSISNGDIKGFEIERSKDGKNFYKIGQISRNLSLSYRFTDSALNHSPIYYYRIKAIELNSISVSKIIMINNTSSLKRNSIILASPVFASGTIKISSENFIRKKITIRNSSGQIVISQFSNQKTSSLNFDFSSLRRGVYFLYIENNSGFFAETNFLKN